MAMRPVHKRYLREFFPAIVAYMVLLIISVEVLQTLQGTGPRVAVTLLPVLPIALMIRAMVRVIRDQDEFERRIDLEAIAIAGGIGGFGFFTYGMLLSARVVPAPPPEAIAIWVLPVLIFCFGVCKCAVRFHYRAR